MSSTVLEIVELPSGEIALRRSNGEGEPLVKIAFSKETDEMMPVMKLEIAKAMMEAGVQAYADLAEEMHQSRQEMPSDASIH